MESIWGTVEADSWSRNFDYDNYVTRHTLTGCKGRLLTVGAYLELCMVLNKEMERDFETTKQQE